MNGFRAGIAVLALGLVQPAHDAGGKDAGPAFPLHVAEGGTYLQDSTGQPYLIHGDTAWSLIAQLKREDVELYLDDRRRRGFNALLVNLIEHQFASKAPANAYGELPFEMGRAFDNIAEEYFDHAAWVLQRAEEFGFVVFLTPAYLGAGGGGQGWYLEATQAGPAALERYGENIARRFASRENIVWVHGGDYSPPDKALVRAVVAGIDRVSLGALHTMHGTRETATADYWAGEQWPSFDTAYTYEDAHAVLLAQRGSGLERPIVMIEGLYEDEHGTGAETVRRQAFGALMAGAAGHFFGNNPIWHFDGPGLFPAPNDWRAALGSPSAESISHLRDIFAELPWWLMSPAERIAGLDIEGDAYLAATPDGSFAVGYFPNVFMSRVRARGLIGEVRWIDPSNGRHYEPLEWTVEEGATLAPPALANAAGQRDWLLVIRAGK